MTATHDHDACIAEMTAKFEASLDQCLDRAEQAEAALVEMTRERDEAEGWLADTQQRLDEASGLTSQLVPNGQSRP